MEKLRPLQPIERDIIARFIALAVDDRRPRYADDLARTTHVWENELGSLLRLEIQGYVRPEGGQDSIRVDGDAKDADGTALSIAVYVDANDHLLEFEIIKWDDTSRPIAPDWSTLKLY